MGLPSDQAFGRRKRIVAPADHQHRQFQRRPAHRPGLCQQRKVMAQPGQQAVPGGRVRDLTMPVTGISCQRPGIAPVERDAPGVWRLRPQTGQDQQFRPRRTGQKPRRLKGQPRPETMPVNHLGPAGSGDLLRQIAGQGADRRRGRFVMAGSASGQFDRPQRDPRHLPAGEDGGRGPGIGQADRGRPRRPRGQRRRCPRTCRRRDRLASVPPDRFRQTGQHEIDDIGDGRMRIGQRRRHGHAGLRLKPHGKADRRQAVDPHKAERLGLGYLAPGRQMGQCRQFPPDRGGNPSARRILGQVRQFGGKMARRGRALGPACGGAAQRRKQPRPKAVIRKGPEPLPVQPGNDLHRLGRGQRPFQRQQRIAGRDQRQANRRDDLGFARTGAHADLGPWPPIDRGADQTLRAAHLDQRIGKAVGGRIMRQCHRTPQRRDRGTDDEEIKAHVTRRLMQDQRRARLEAHGFQHAPGRGIGDPAKPVLPGGMNDPAQRAGGAAQGRKTIAQRREIARVTGHQPDLGAGGLDPRDPRGMGDARAGIGAAAHQHHAPGAPFCQPDRDFQPQPAQPARHQIGSRGVKHRHHARRGPQRHQFRRMRLTIPQGQHAGQAGKIEPIQNLSGAGVAVQIHHPATQVGMFQKQRGPEAPKRGLRRVRQGVRAGLHAGAGQQIHLPGQPGDAQGLHQRGQKPDPVAVLLCLGQFGRQHRLHVQRRRHQHAPARRGAGDRPGQQADQGAGHGARRRAVGHHDPHQPRHPAAPRGPGPAALCPAEMDHPAPARAELPRQRLGHAIPIANDQPVARPIPCHRGVRRRRIGRRLPERPTQCGMLQGGLGTARLRQIHIEPVTAALERVAGHILGPNGRIGGQIKPGPVQGRAIGIKHPRRPQQRGVFGHIAARQAGQRDPVGQRGADKCGQRPPRSDLDIMGAARLLQSGQRRRKAHRFARVPAPMAAVRRRAQRRPGQRRDDRQLRRGCGNVGGSPFKPVKDRIQNRRMKRHRGRQPAGRDTVLRQAIQRLGHAVFGPGKTAGGGAVLGRDGQSGQAPVVQPGPQRPGRKRHARHGARIGQSGHQPATAQGQKHRAIKFQHARRQTGGDLAQTMAGHCGRGHAQTAPQPIQRIGQCDQRRLGKVDAFQQGAIAEKDLVQPGQTWIGAAQRRRGPAQCLGKDRKTLRQPLTLPGQMRALTGKKKTRTQFRDHAAAGRQPRLQRAGGIGQVARQHETAPGKMRPVPGQRAHQRRQRPRRGGAGMAGQIAGQALQRPLGPG